MARRTHVTPVGWVPCDELSQLGAGRKEGWLTDSPLLTALHSHCLALANGSLAFVLGWEEYRHPSSAARPVRVRPSLSPSEGEITAIEWISVDDLVALALGTSGGYLLLYSKEADLIHKQFVHPGRVLRLRLREIEDKPSGDSFSYELCVVMPGVLARFDGADIKRLLQRWFHDSWEDRLQKREEAEADTFGRIPFQVWNVSKFGTCADAAITGIMPPPLLELPSRERYYCAVTVGDDAVISAYRLSEDRSRSLVGTILSKVVPAAFSTIASFSNMIWRSEQAQPKRPEVKPQSFAKASPLTCLKDHPRKGEKLTSSPSGSLAAITDSLGRILLLDTQALVVVRLWKGYRDACCLFMEMFIGREKASSSSAHYEQTKSDYCLCLAIHAPKKGIIETSDLLNNTIAQIWKMRTGPRLLTIQCPKGSKILQPSTRFGSSSTSSSHSPLEVFLWNGDSGQLSVLNRFIG